MKQLLQSMKTGVTEIIEVPCPQTKTGHVLIATRQSLISSGTEKMLVNFGKASLFEKTRQQPEKARMVLNKIATDGLLTTLDAVRDKLNQLIPMGYCNVGTVMDTGKDTGFTIGERVLSNGSHAEVVCVPKNLCCKIPDNVSDDAAAFTVLGAIALQGIRLAQPTLGENFVVIGLGLIGLLTVQLLRAQGCRVMGIDFDAKKIELAKQYGAETVVNLSQGEDPIAIAQTFSQQNGVDGVMITAATVSNEPMHQAAQMSRKRGRIVLIGVTGLQLIRDDFYKKELSFQVSCSYGPGRYDPQYEEQGHDYPIGFVRWTEQRNFETFLNLLANKKIEVESLISHRFAFSQAQEAYTVLSDNKDTLGILLRYEEVNHLSPQLKTKTIQLNPTVTQYSSVCIGLIGAGNYATRILMPAFKSTNATLKIIASNGGVSGALTGRRFRFEKATTDVNTIFADSQINTVVIATHHNSHANFVCDALNANKHVFVEKPLCLTFQELDTLTELFANKTSQLLMVGFNRRFAPHIQKIKKLLNGIHEPKSFIMTVNAGDIPSEHWTQNNQIGGGRIIGEVCHFIDLLRYLAAAPISDYHVTKIRHDIKDDKVTITLSFEDDSFGIIHYLANGHKSFPKERLEIFTAGKILQLDNFRKLRGFGWSTFKSMNLWRQDKGQETCIQTFVNAIIHGLPSPIPINELIEVSRVTMEIAYH